MKLSIRPMFGMTLVRGGRILRVSHDHQVPTKGYDRRPDDTLGSSRSFDVGWVTASVGDLSVEVVATKTKRILGYAYLSGPAINIIRYVSDAERALVAGWFTPGRGVRVTLLSEDMDTADGFVRGMAKIKYGDADIAAARVEVQKGAAIGDAMKVLAMGYECVAGGRESTTDFVAKICARGTKEVGVAHFQAPGRAQACACQPFFCDVLLSSDALQDQPFSTAVDASA